MVSNCFTSNLGRLACLCFMACTHNVRFRQDMGISWPSEYPSPPSPRLSPAAALDGNSAPAMESSATTLGTRGVEGMVTFMVSFSPLAMASWFVLRRVDRGAEETRSLFFWPQIGLVGHLASTEVPRPTMVDHVNHGSSASKPQIP